jgi:hypothetical protein
VVVPKYERKANLVLKLKLDAKTEGLLEKDGMSMWSQKRFNCPYHEVKKNNKKKLKFKALKFTKLI